MKTRACSVAGLTLQAPLSLPVTMDNVFLGALSVMTLITVETAVTVVSKAPVTDYHPQPTAPYLPQEHHELSTQLVYIPSTSTTTELCHFTVIMIMKSCNHVY
jgi:hypothetical protein